MTNVNSLSKKLLHQALRLEYTEILGYTYRNEGSFSRVFEVVVNIGDGVFHFGDTFVYAAVYFFWVLVEPRN